MKTVSLFAVCSVLAVSSAFAQGNGLTIVFDKDTPASDRQAFVESYNHQQDLKRNQHNERKVITQGGLAPSQVDYTGVNKDKPMSWGDSINKNVELNLARKAADIQDIKDRTNNERIMAENGDSQGLANSRQERSNRETSERLRQIQISQQRIQNQNNQIQFQNTQREIGY